MSLLGIEIGTTGCKAIVFRVDGQVLGHAYREYPLIHPREGWAELDPEGVWTSVSEAVGQAVDRAGPGDPVRALATSVQGEAVTPVARDGTILANSPVTFDGRTVPYVEEWEKKVGREEIFRITGMPLHPMYTLNKIMWWQRERPEVYHRAWKFLCYGDFALQRLGLEGEVAVAEELPGAVVDLRPLPLPPHDLVEGVHRVQRHPGDPEDLLPADLFLPLLDVGHGAAVEGDGAIGEDRAVAGDRSDRLAL